MRARRRERWVLIAASLSVIGLVVGCGSSSKTSSPGTSGGPSTGTKSEIAVGVIGSYSGPFADSQQPAKLAVQAWAAEVNASGGINGHPVKLYIEDDKGVTASAVTMVKKLVEQDQVVAIVGQISSASTAWASYVASKGVPVIGGSSQSDLAYMTNADFYAVGGNLLSLFYGVSAQAKTHGTKWGALYCAEIAPCAAVTNIAKAYTPSTGVSVAFAGSVAATASDYTAQCQALKNAGVESYTIALGLSAVPRVAGQCAQQGLKAVHIFPGTEDSNTASQPTSEGMEFADSNYPFFDESIPAAKAMHDAFRKYSPSLGSSAAPSNPFAVGAYLGGKLFEAAVKAAGTDSITSASVKQGIYALKGETLGGMSPPLTFKEGQPNLFNCYYAGKVTGGKFVTLNDGKPQCAPDSVIAPVAASLTKG